MARFLNWWFISLIFAVHSGVLSAVPADGLGKDWGGNLEPFWTDDPGKTAEEMPDTYGAFRGHFELSEAGDVEIRTLGASWFVGWMDGEYLLEGPARFPLSHPQYDTHRVHLEAGKHVIAFQVHHYGVSTRMLDEVRPFLACAILRTDSTVPNQTVPIQWRSIRLSGYEAEVRRLNPQLAWIEWCDTRQIPMEWRQPDFEDSDWHSVVACQPKIGEFEPVTLANVRSITHKLEPIASGPLAETFGYEHDDEPARFFLRDLVCKNVPAQGVWRRYDLGRVRLARPRFILDLPEGAVVEFAYCEALAHDRVSPFITLSAGDSCNLDHYVARGGRQEFFPLAPRGGRFVEVHVLADVEKIEFIEEAFVERCYHSSPIGSFKCSDPLLERIWMTGIETYRGCAEDALIDNPSRERGQWTGDVVSVGMDISAVGYSDLRLIRRGLIQSGQCAREDGMIAGLCPGGEAYLTTSAAQWISACMHYCELTGDDQFLDSAFPLAERNVEAFVAKLSDAGLADELGWGFVDWGYVRNQGPSDMAVNMHFLEALRNMVRWCHKIQRDERESYYLDLQHRVETIVKKWLDGQLQSNDDPLPTIGYHRTALGLRLDLFPKDFEPKCIAFLKNHMQRCFPNDMSAPRNADPTKSEPRLITPYFAHYAFPELIERGEMPFIMDQYRKCWGWALRDDRTTWVEVFDTRWSYCHQWSGCPTWQLSRYALGLHPQFDLGKNRFRFFIAPADLKHASGKITVPGHDWLLSVQWRQVSATEISYRLSIPDGITIQVAVDESQETISVSGTRQCRLTKKDGKWCLD